MNNLNVITTAKDEVETRLKKEQTNNKRTSKENSAREEELWTALQKAQEDHETTLEELKRETHERVCFLWSCCSRYSVLQEKLEVKVSELRRVRDKEIEKVKLNDGVIW